MENVILSLATIIARQERDIEALRRSKSNGAAVTQSWMDGTWADINALQSPSMGPEARLVLHQALNIVERNGGMDPAEREANKRRAAIAKAEGRS